MSEHRNATDDRPSDLVTECALDPVWAARQIKELQETVVDLTDALWNWWGDGSCAHFAWDEHADWCSIDDDEHCICGRSIFP